jgi:hypothetical protein
MSNKHLGAKCGPFLFSVPAKFDVGCLVLDVGCNVPAESSAHAERLDGEKQRDR